MKNKIFIIIISILIILVIISLLTGFIKINIGKDTNNFLLQNQSGQNPEELRENGRCGHRDDGKTITDPNNPNQELICTYIGNTCPRFVWIVKEDNKEYDVPSEFEPGKKCGHVRDGDVIDDPKNPDQQLICTYIEDNEPKFSWQVVDGDLVLNLNPNNSEVKEGNACGFKNLDNIEKDFKTNIDLICVDRVTETPRYVWEKYE